MSDCIPRKNTSFKALSGTFIAWANSSSVSPLFIMTFFIRSIIPLSGNQPTDIESSAGDRSFISFSVLLITLSDIKFETSWYGKSLYLGPSPVSNHNRLYLLYRESILSAILSVIFFIFPDCKSYIWVGVAPMLSANCFAFSPTSVINWSIISFVSII